MDNEELKDIYEFHRNMRKTAWEQLFPHWWDTQDSLLKAIGDEVERIKAVAIFALLNAGIKPPVLLWQESIEHEQYHFNSNITQLPHTIKIQAPLYKTWGKITLTNNTVKDIDGLIIKLNERHGLVINQLIAQSDIISIDLHKNQTTLNDEIIDTQPIGEGIPYFVTQQNHTSYHKNTPLHNEVIRITFGTHESDDIQCDIDIDVQLDNAVFTNEQNIEITGLEAVPIDRVELYAEYDFKYNKPHNGWHKVYEKKYNRNTNVIHDMITTHLYTKKFYVDVYFKTLQYPYQVGFPCTKDALKYSLYHVNPRLDKWGEVLSLPRRSYKDNIDEKDYYNTYPIYYPFDIEQDYYYYKRLTSEYVWNNIAVNDIDILDTNNNPIIRLYAIDPFIEDIVVHAKTIYPNDKEFSNNIEYKSNTILQKHTEGVGIQTEFDDIINLIADTEKPTSITLNNKTDNNDVIYKQEDIALQNKQQQARQEQIKKLKQEYEQSLSDALDKKQKEAMVEDYESTIDNNSIDVSNIQLTTEEKQQILQECESNIKYIHDITHQSTELITFFDLSSLPKDINIDDIQVIIEGNSNDNKTNKYSTENTGLLIPNYHDNQQTFIPLTADKYFQLKKQPITYSNSDTKTILKNISIDDENIIQQFTIGQFESKIHDFVKIPFKLKENNEIVDDFTEIWLYFNDTIRRASYEEDENGENYIYCYVPNLTIMDEITIICKSATHYSFTYNFKIIRMNKYDEDDNNKILYQYITGPIVDGVIVEEITESLNWHTNDIRNLLKNEGIYFRQILKNIDEQSSTTVNQYNIKLNILYSQKKSQFLLSTSINKYNIQKPHIGQYSFTIENIGDKKLQTHVDIFNPPNIQLSRNSFNINLDVHESFQCEPIDIMPTYPISDGFYDIVTMCEDIIKTNSIEVFSNGLIETGIQIYQHVAKYDEESILHASISTVDNSIVDDKDAKIQFYIDDFLIGETQIINNEADLFFSPKDYDFINSGHCTLKAKFTGTTKYAASVKSTTIFISKNTTRMTLIANSSAIYKGHYLLQAKVEYYKDNQYYPVTDGNVEFYINDEILSTNTTMSNGLFISYIDKIDNPAGDYKLRAKYIGSNIYATTEIIQNFKIIGGHTYIETFDVVAKPFDTITLQAQVHDEYGNNIHDGYIDFIIKDNNDNQTNLLIPNFDELTKNIPLDDDGFAYSQALPLQEVLQNNNKTYTIESFYHYNLNTDDDELYQQSKNTSTLTIKKGTVIFDHQPVFYGTQYEPLGFYVNVKDSTTNDIITDGVVQLQLLTEQITLEAQVDENGNAIFLHNPLEFSQKEWNELEKFSFNVDNDDLWKSYTGDDDNILIDFYYDINNGTLHFIGDQLNHNYYKNYNECEYVYITDGHLYARTSNDMLRQYSLNTQDIKLTYIENNQYAENEEYIQNGLNINNTKTNLDIYSYDLYYTDDDNLTCFVSQYNNDLTTQDTYGTVQFYIDNNIIDTVDIIDNKATINTQKLAYIKAGNHLLCVKHVPTIDTYEPISKPTYSYSYLNLKKQSSVINIETSDIMPGRIADITVTLSSLQYVDVLLTGNVKIFLNNECIDEYYLNGTELITGIGDKENNETNINDLTNKNTVQVIFKIIIPQDIDEHQYNLTVQYDGNEFFTPSNTFNNPLILSKTKYPVNILVKDNIYVANNEICFINVGIQHNEDIINEGEVIIRHGQDLVASSNINNNHATLSFIPQDDITSYNIIYRNANNYLYADKKIDIHVIEPMSNISIPNENQSNIQEALMCLQEDGTIYITDDIILTESITINKNCTIVSENDTSFIKDVQDLLVTLDNVNITSLSTLSEPLYKIDNLSLQNLNTTDFYIDNTPYGQDIFFKGQSGNIQIFLCDDGNFYSQSKLNLQTMLSHVNIIIKDCNVHFHNCTFKSNDSNSINDLIIYNQGKCHITHSIIENTVKIINKNELIANQNLMYGTIQGNKANLDNNWWGSNTSPYPTNNHIIIKVEPNNSPAVISEDCQIIGKIIGVNNKYYDIPQLNFKFTADSGYFSIDSGVITNQHITTTYLDADKEGYVYFTVDNETVSCPIYDYQYKTEITFNDINDIVINHQSLITARVQSCADLYYEFDSDNNIIDKSHPINEGHITFYLQEVGTEKREQIGYAPVINGESSVKVFFTNAVYGVNKYYYIFAEYHTDGQYFDTKSQIKIHTINEDDSCFVSSNGNDNNNGTYSNPVASITKALTLNKDTIYILQGEYNEQNISITNNVTIKKYNGNVIFKELYDTNDESYLFKICENARVNIIGLDFINNNLSQLIQNNGYLYIGECIFYKNQNVLFNNNASINNFNVYLSAIIDNDIISNDIVSDNYSQCWFGSNTPPDGINNYIIMSYDKSKDIIYNGTLVHVTAQLDSYMDNNEEYKLESLLPLRIAKFSSDIGSVKPIKDYTYNNQSTSLIDTTTDSNTSQYIIELENDTFYDKHDISIVCVVKDVYDNIITPNKNNFKIYLQSDDINIDIDDSVIIEDNKIVYNIMPLPIGKYKINCIYNNNGKIYKLTTYIYVKKLEIQLHNLSIDNGNHLYYTHIYANVKDNFNNILDNEQINISINDNFIKTCTVQNGIIDEYVRYTLIHPNTYSLIFDNQNINSDYDIFNYEYPLTVSMAQSIITFDYDTIEADVSNNFVVELNDENNKEIQSGCITVLKNDEIIYDNLAVVNGVAILKDFNIQTKGQYTITIYYHDAEGYYQDATYVNNKFNVGMFNVQLESSGNNLSDFTITSDIDDLNIPITVYDMSHKLVQHGLIDVLIDDIVITEANQVSNGTVDINVSLPNNIYAGLHEIKFIFYGNSRFIDTEVSSILKINAIQTNIEINTISGPSGQNTTIDYHINSHYNRVNTGALSAFLYINDEEVFLGSSDVTSSIINQISFITPLLPAGDNYEILFKYHDNDNQYQDSELLTKFIITKTKVIINVNNQTYYPKEDFILDIDVKNIDGYNVNNGYIDVYIDNVREYDNIEVLNGQAQVLLNFERARHYNIDIVYLENKYYSQTHSLLDIDINNIDIENIDFKNELTVQVDNVFENELIFDTNGHDVYDGIVDILLDNNFMGSYYITADNKYINVDTTNVSRGTHSLTLKYHDSVLFNDYEKSFELIVTAKHIDLLINPINHISQDIHVNATDMININLEVGLHDNNTWISQPINGIVNYYLMIPQYKKNDLGERYIDSYNNRFIGSESFKNEYTHDDPYQYGLSTDLLEYDNILENTHYKLKAEFIGNDIYEPSETCVQLIIHKQDIDIIVPESITVEYQSNLEFDIALKHDEEYIDNQELVEIYIDDSFVGSCNIDSGQGTFSCKLKDVYHIGEHIIQTRFNGSTINRGPKYVESTLYITPLTPKLCNNHIESYIGNHYIIDGTIIDKRGNKITDGTLKCKIHNGDIIDVQPSTTKTIQIDESIVNDWNIEVEYISNNTNMYNNFTSTISVTMLKNDITLTLDAPEYIYRDTPFDIVITANTTTTTAPINLSFDRLSTCDNATVLDTYNMQNGELIITMTLPLVHYDNKQFITCFKTLGNDIFNSQNIQYSAVIKNQNYVTIDTTQELSSSNAHSLEQAIDFVSDYGIIEIISPLENETIEQLSKNVTIKGNTQLSNCTINNRDKKLVIENLTFQNATQTCIHNESILTINKCTFKDNQDTTIYTDGAATITNTHFEHNQANNGACIYVANKNYKTSITNCTFNENYASLYGGCIYSNKVNDIEILNNKFYNNNHALNGGSSIYGYGNITISSNSFYNNQGKNEIHLLRGVFSIDKNLFDGKIQSIRTQQESTIDADLNYWGYNNIDIIQNINNIEINNYLIADYHKYKKESNEYVTCHINKYINRLESETTTINILEPTLPVTIKGDTESNFTINQEIPIQQDTIIIIGQDEFVINI